MDLRKNSVYKLVKQFSNKDTYHVKLTSELLEDLEKCQNISEVIINIDEKTGTLTIPSRNNLSKVFNLNVEPITRGEKESLEINVFKPNQTVECMASLNVRLNVQATSKVYDMTKKKIVEVDDANKKHCAKELKMPVSTNEKGLAYKVFQNKESRKSEINAINETPKIISATKPDHNNSNKTHQFTIREKVMHLLALKPTSKDGLLLSLQKMGVTSVDRNEVVKHLQQVATLNKENMYQLSSQFIHEIRSDWPQFDMESKKRIAKLKSDSKTKLPSQLNNTQISRHSLQQHTTMPGNDDVLDRHPVRKAPLAPHSTQTKITALNMLATGKSVAETARVLNVSEKVLQSWKSLENKIRQVDRNKPIVESPTSTRDCRQNTISPAESNSSSKTFTSNDEGFVSGDKGSPSSQQNKRHSPHLTKTSLGVPDSKKIRLSSKNSTLPFSFNDQHSSSSCDVTPTSDVSQPSDSFAASDPKLDFNNTNNFDTNSRGMDILKTNDADINATQDSFNIAFEEYTKLCDKLKEREAVIENFRNSCKNIKMSEYPKQCKIAKSLLDQMESPQFLELTARVKVLESEMCEYVSILTGKPFHCNG